MTVHQLLHITRTVCITPLVEIRNPIFQKWYRNGIRWCHHERKDDGPLADRYFADQLLICTNYGSFDSRHDNALYKRIGFTLGSIHGGVLLPNGMLRPGVKTLVTLDDTETRRGYEAGREFFFLVADRDEDWNYTDARLIERIKRSAIEHMTDHSEVRLWYFAVGCFLGELSGQLFPWTREEHRRVEEDKLKRAIYHKLPERCLAARLFSPVAVS